MTAARLEAFSDGVIAIVITIMVLELQIPHEPSLDALRGLWPVFGTYVLSFVNLGIYWNNHHHLLRATERINGAVLWANLHLLFWLSLFPFVSGWMGENHFAQWTVVLYGVTLIMAGAAYYLLTLVLLAAHGTDSVLVQAIGAKFKERISLLIYAVAIGLTFVNPWIGVALYGLVAMVWLVPDRRIEQAIGR